MDTEPTVEAELLAQAKKQTEALESLRGLALVWTFIAALAAVAWLIVAIATGS